VITPLVVLAATTDPDQQRSLIDDAGPIAMAFVVVLGIALFLLYRSMTKQMRKIDPQLPSGPDDREQELDREVTDEAVERGSPDADDASGR
jgi:hypothetical protein